MKALLDKLHARLGDFWWYTLMIFMAARAADCLNVFVGLWLVPKYVPPSELGAVMPLSNFAAFLAIPVGVFATTFRQELSNLAVKREFGKLKTLMRGVFIATAVFIVFAITVSHFLLPHYLERIRIAEGSLGMLILAYSFINAISPIFSNPLQALKKFKATTVISLVGAPVRLLTMLATIPLRALSGYFVGQASVPSFSIVTSVIALRKELSVKAEPYWTKSVVRRFGKLFLIFGASAVLGGISELVQSTVLRQRLPDVDSAAYYMVTRFSEITSFLSSTLLITIFPFAAELAAKGRSTHGLVNKSFGAIVITNALLALCFCLVGKPLLELLPQGQAYADFWWAIPCLIGISTLNAYGPIFLSAEIAANRFRSLFVTLPLTIIYTGGLLLVTGQGYYINCVGAKTAGVLDAVNVTSLKSMLAWMGAAAVIRYLIYAVYSRHTRKRLFMA